MDFTENDDQNNMLNDCLINVLKEWLIVEPKHTDKVKKMIIENIEKKKISDIEEMNNILEEEYIGRYNNEGDIYKKEEIKIKYIIKYIKSELLLIL